VKRVGIVLLGPLVAVGLYALLRAPVTSGPSTHDAAARIERMWEARRSDAWVEVAGVVEKLLPDDRHGSRHQRFIVRLDGGHRILVSHNLDLAPRIDALAAGDTVTVRGEYEWNPRGGVVHWTHHAPRGRRPGGWVRHDGRVYR
jgi:hypothetical protein